MSVFALKRILFAVPLLVIAGATTASAQSTIADCEKIQAADAYNQCLAKFGPPAKEHNLEPERPGDVKAGPADAAASRVSRGGGGRHAGRGRHHGGGSARRGRSHGGHAGHAGGRKRMTIKVK